MKRILCVLLTVLLLAGLLPAATPAAEAAANTGFQALNQYVRENGVLHEGFGKEIYSMTLRKTMWSSGSASSSAELRLDYDPNNNEIEILSMLVVQSANFIFNAYDIDMMLNSDGSFENVYCVCSGSESHYNLAPSSFTRETILKAYEYVNVSESQSHARLDNAASTLLKETLEAYRRY